MNDYFETRAAAYAQNSNKGLWHFIRVKESRALFNQLGDISGRNILELGCGAGYYTTRLLEHNPKNIVAVDSSQAMVATLSSPNITAIVADAQRLDLGQSFDLIVCAGLLEFVEKPVSVLKRAREHARSDSKLIILAPQRNVWGLIYRAFHSSHGISIKLFDKYQLAEAARASGWHCKAITYAWPFAIVVTLETLK